MPKFFNVHDLNILWRESITMVGDRGRRPERPEDQGQQTRRRDSQSQPRSSRERLEQMRREGGMSSDQQENLQRANEALLNRLRPHLTPNTLLLIEGYPALFPVPALEPAPPHVMSLTLNAINTTLNMSIIERRESNQRTIDSAPDEGRDRLTRILIMDEMARVIHHAKETPAMDSLNEQLAWENHLPTEWRRDVDIGGIFNPGMRRIRDETENMPEAERHEIRRTWLNRIPDQYREPLARALGELNPEQRRLILRDRIPRLMGLDDDRHRQTEWRRMKADGEVSAYITPEIEAWRRNQRAAIDDQEMEIWEEVDRGSRPEQELSDFRNRSTSEYTLQEMQKVLDEINRQIDQ